MEEDEKPTISVLMANSVVYLFLFYFVFIQLDCSAQDFFWGFFAASRVLCNTRTLYVRVAFAFLIITYLCLLVTEE